MNETTYPKVTAALGKAEMDMEDQGHVGGGELGGVTALSEGVRVDFSCEGESRQDSKIGQGASHVDIWEKSHASRREKARRLPRLQQKAPGMGGRGWRSESGGAWRGPGCGRLYESL